MAGEINLKLVIETVGQVFWLSKLNLEMEKELWKFYFNPSYTCICKWLTNTQIGPQDKIAAPWPPNSSSHMQLSIQSWPRSHKFYGFFQCLPPCFSVSHVYVLIAEFWVLRSDFPPWMRVSSYWCLHCVHTPPLPSSSWCVISPCKEISSQCLHFYDYVNIIHEWPI